ncbi:MAG: iron-containing alcohol dehydrogenase, partial [Anaerolineales bacterium]|nr:iron-containing alcohol dehydrogenase [Anaerolineales bacterium]
MHFEFATAQRIIFGVGRLSQVGLLADSMGTRILVVRGRSSGRSQYLIDILADHDLFLTQFVVDREPTIEMIHLGARIARESLCDLVIGIGGGSVIDAGKAIAALLTNEGDVFDYLEVIGRGKPLSSPPKPYIAIPTTAGTGAEVTPNASFIDDEINKKLGINGEAIRP